MTENTPETTQDRNPSKEISLAEMWDLYEHTLNHAKDFFQVPMAHPFKQLMDDTAFHVKGLQEAINGLSLEALRELALAYYTTCSISSTMQDGLIEVINTLTGETEDDA